MPPAPFCLLWPFQDRFLHNFLRWFLPRCIYFEKNSFSYRNCSLPFLSLWCRRNFNVITESASHKSSHEAAKRYKNSYGVIPVCPIQITPFPGCTVAFPAILYTIFSKRNSPAGNFPHFFAKDYILNSCFHVILNHR